MLINLTKFLKYLKTTSIKVSLRSRRGWFAGSFYEPNIYLILKHKDITKKRIGCQYLLNLAPNFSKTLLRNCQKWYINIIHHDPVIYLRYARMVQHRTINHCDVSHWQKIGTMVIWIDRAIAFDKIQYHFRIKISLQIIIDNISAQLRP